MCSFGNGHRHRHGHGHGHGYRHGYRQRHVITQLRAQPPACPRGHQRGHWLHRQCHLGNWDAPRATSCCCFLLKRCALSETDMDNGYIYGQGYRHGIWNSNTTT